MIRPLRDAHGPFHEEPDDLAAALEARGLRLIEPSGRFAPSGVLPHLEEEAIARLRGAVGPLSESEAEWKREGWDWWRSRWVNEAHYFLRHAGQGPANATPAYSAAEMLVRAASLRGAIADGDAEKAAALAMLVASWVFVGGVSIRLALAEPAAAKHGAYRKTQRAKALRERTTVRTDEGGVRKRDLVAEALRAAGPEAGTAEVWEHLFAVLEGRGMRPVEHGAKAERVMTASDSEGDSLRFSFKAVQTMLRMLRPNAAPPRGRPRKKPA